MNRQKKPLFILMLLACFLLAAAGTARASSGGGSGITGLAPKKIISIVYDDSGSMIGDATESANYAVQVFEALMGSGDELYITFMSDVEEGKRTSQKIDLGNVDKAVSDFRTRQYNYHNTPLASVEVAMETLQKVHDNDPNTQYWLVILTDGDMDQTAPTKYQDLDSALLDIKGTPMSNGTPLHTYYFGIGDGAKTVTPDPGNQLHAVSSPDIVPTLGDIANVISGRIKYGSNEVTFVDDHTVRVKSDLPLFSLSAFTQKSNAKVTGAECTDEDGKKITLKVDRNVRVEGMPPNNQQLFGNVAVVNNGSKALPSGEYTITFSEAVDSSNTVLMFQPAISLEVEVKKGGTVVTDFSTVTAGDDLEFRLVPIDMYTGKEIDPSRLPKGTTWEISWDDGSGPHTSAGSSEKISGINPGDFTLGGSLSIPELIPIPANVVTFHVDDYAPEFRLRLTITKKGNLTDDVIYDNVDGINNLAGLEATDLIDVHLEAFDNLTGDPIDAARLGGTENYNITYEVNGAQEGSVASQDYDNISLKAGSNRIIGDYECVGNVLQEVVDFEVAPMAVYDLDLENGDHEYLRGKLKGHETDEKTPLVWILRDEDADQDGVGDGSPRRLQQQECTGNKNVLFKSQKVENLDDIFILNRGFAEADTEIVLNTDGSFSVYPSKHNWLTRFFAPYIIRTGEYHVTVQLDVNGKETEVTYKVRPRWQDWIPLIVELIVAYIISRIIRLVFVKPKFKKGSRIVVTAYEQNEDSEGVERPGLGGSTTLKPYGRNPLSLKPARWEIPKLGFKIYAEERGGAYFLQTEVGDMAWGTSLVDPKRFEKLVEDVRSETEARGETAASAAGSGETGKKKKKNKNKKKGAKAPRKNLSTSPVYFVNAQGTRIYEVVRR